MKRAVLQRVGAAALAAIIIAMTAPTGGFAQPVDPADLAGVWAGSLTIMGAQLPFSLTLFVDADTLSGTMSAQGVEGLEITDLAADGGGIRFQRLGPAGALAFEGRVFGDSIHGTLNQGTVEGTFSLRRSGGSGARAVAAAPEGSGSPPSPLGGRWGSLTSCRPPGLASDVLCGSYAVPEDRSARGGRLINLNVVVLPALGGVADSIPMVMLAGGPGGAATQMAPALGIQFPTLRERFHIILVDQRGTGSSNPLQCTYRDVNEMARAVLQVDFDDGALAACRDSLDADLTQYHTSIAMDDLVDVVQALGHRRINVYGLSYGTRAALVLARRHPETVRSLVLQGVAPPSLLLPLDVAKDAQAALDGVFADCAADPECGAAYPDLRRALARALAGLAEGSVRVPARDPVTGAPGSLEVTEDVFTGGLRSLLYASPFIQAIPRLVHAAGNGDYEPFTEAVLPLIQSFGQTLYFGMYLSVACTEDVPFIEPDVAVTRSRNTFLGDGMVRNHREACRNWPRGVLPEGFHEPVRSPVPALLVSGASDPVTPPRWAEEAARYLPNSLSIVVPRAAHADSVGPCELGIVAAFMSSGSTAGLDLSCVAEGRTRRYGLHRK